MISVSALPLLAYKVGPNLFDLSSNLHQVSMRDQIHRAVALAEALVAGNQLQPGQQALIVGAGVAGVVAGMVLARHGVEVQIVDASVDAPFRLQRGVATRYVGPYMYEWPLVVHGCQQMPPPVNEALFPWAAGKPKALPFSTSFPASPDDLVKDWEPILKQAIANSGGRLRLQVGINSPTTNRDVKRWLRTERYIAEKRHPRKRTRAVTIHGGTPWGGSQKPYAPLVPRFVLLAAGMGAENNIVTDSSGNILLQGDAFWANDEIRKPYCGLSSPPRVVVIGGGDGGLQDALRAATIDDHPLATWDRLLAADTNKVLPEALADIQAMEAQHGLNAIWTATDPFRNQELPTLDAAYQKLATSLAGDQYVERALLSSLRKDVSSVHLCIKDACFSKAYALNRFLVHLLEQCTKKAAGAGGSPFVEVTRNVTLTSAKDNSAMQTLNFSNGMTLHAEIVIVRFGPDRSALPAQWLGLTTKDTVNRQELAAVPLPLYLPPSR
ncbi:FAD-dependent monooxygenase [Stenotrophomonas sp. YIM B13575]|uniref:FAD-dependent monooxygenase n=1 Tax=Stenotrophomonas sp. YIM B13575 TaxID=3366314 RepID=UPI0036B1A4A9